ncbi:MAG: 4Fe-4S dicluster domain-containing protein, partial [Dehalococcoidia bacterium]
DEDLKPVTNGDVPPYQNPDMDKRYGRERRSIAGGGHTKGVIEKCTFCVQRVEKGLQPACVANCPVFALHFGDLDDPNSNVSQLIAKRRSFRLDEEWNTSPRVYYLGEPPSTQVREIERPKVRV